MEQKICKRNLTMDYSVVYFYFSWGESIYFNIKEKESVIHAFIKEEECNLFNFYWMNYMGGSPYNSQLIF